MRHDELTPRERECAQLLAGGLSNFEIGKKLGISPSTVRSHLRNVFMRLGAKNRTHAAVIMQRKPSLIPRAVPSLQQP